MTDPVAAAPETFPDSESISRRGVEPLRRPGVERIRALPDESVGGC